MVSLVLVLALGCGQQDGHWYGLMTQDGGRYVLLVNRSVTLVYVRDRKGERVAAATLDVNKSFKYVSASIGDDDLHVFVWPESMTVSGAKGTPFLDYEPGTVDELELARYQHLFRFATELLSDRRITGAMQHEVAVGTGTVLRDDVSRAEVEWCDTETFGSGTVGTFLYVLMCRGMG